MSDGVHILDTSPVSLIVSVREADRYVHFLMSTTDILIVVSETNEMLSVVKSLYNCGYITNNRTGNRTFFNMTNTT